MQKIAGFLFCLCHSLACSESEGIKDFIDDRLSSDAEQLLTIEASREELSSESRTIRQEDGSVYWTPNDEISLFFMQGNEGGYKFTSQNTETAAVAEFSGTINGMTGGGENLFGDAYFWAVYPYSPSNSCDGTAVTTSLPNKQQAVEGTFADDLFITIARALGVKMSFKNVCGGLKFCVSQSGIKSIVFRGNNEEILAGEFKASFNEQNTPTISEIINGETEITVVAPNGGTFEVGQFYYMVALPAPLKNGFTLTFNKADGTSGVYTRTSGVEIKRSTFGTVRNLDKDLVYSADNTPIENNENGFYLGIIGFNQQLRTYPIRHLSEESADGFHSFIDGLSTNKGTLLYYAVDKSVDALQEASFPSNLYDVAVVTFTDGLDIGSLDASDDYLTNSEYSTALKSRLNDETVSGQDISAYSIGVRGDDVGNNYTLFQQNLKNLATSSANVFEVTNMSEVNETFMKIADLLGETKYVQNFLLEISSPSVGARCRFTFDDVSRATDSKQYIEATFIRPEEDRSLRTLCELTFVGLTSTTVAPVVGVKNESNNKYVYPFEGLQSTDGELISTDHVQYWYKEGSVWQRDSEFYFDPGTAGIEKIKRSAAILLNLDCSSSLGDDFPALQRTAKSFIDKLIENAVDPNEVSSIKLNKSAITLPVGTTTTLTATVLPSTAFEKTVEWSSTNAAVATVDQKGNVTGVSSGSTTIIAKTLDGGFTAVCYITVVTLAQEIQLNCSELELYNGETYTLQASIFPESTSNKSLVWSSSNTAVATINDKGLITPIKAGQTTITASSVDGSGIKAVCSVTVLQHVESVALDSASALMNVGDTKQLSVTISPSNASNKTVLWKSSNPSVVSVSSTGLLTALKVGKAQVTATSEEGGRSATCEVEVTQYVSGITLNKSSATLYVNEKLQMTATISPTDAVNKSVTWSSSNTAVATVDQKGLLTALTPGTATISVKAQDSSGVVAKCTLTVKQHVSSISLSSSSMSLSLGISKTLTATISPSDASNKNFTVVSANSSVATVSKSGTSITVNPVGIGSTTITVTTEDGGYTATCSVSVALSKTPINLALSVKKNNVRYFVPQSAYSTVNLSGYSKEGIAIVSGSTSFVLDLADASSASKTWSEALKLGTLPNRSQASIICQYWSNINSALSTYGGTPLSRAYWTSEEHSSGRAAYSYSSSGVTYITPATQCNVRKIVATL